MPKLACLSRIVPSPPPSPRVLKKLRDRGRGWVRVFWLSRNKFDGISHKALWYSYDPDLFVLNFVLSAFCIQLATTDPPSVPPWKPCDPRKILRSPRPLACHTWTYNQRQSCWHIDLFNTRLLQFHLFCPFWINLFAPSPRGGGGLFNDKDNVRNRSVIQLIKWTLKHDV